MNLPGHTPGPWRAQLWMADNSTARVFGPKGETLATVHEVRGEGSANQELIVSAPDLAAKVKALELQYREAAKMASILLDYIHALKRHEGSVENCRQEPCPATIEFLSKSQKRNHEDRLLKPLEGPGSVNE